MLGATLYYGALVFAVEATSQPYLAGFGAAFTSNSNPVVAQIIMYVSMAGVVIVAGWLLVRASMSANRTMAPQLKAGQPPARQEPTPAAQ